MSDVLFRGPMMVFTQGTEAKSIRIPNAEAETSQRFHPDDDPATEHTSGMLIANSSTTQSSVPPKRFSRLKGRRITISDGTTDPCLADPSLSQLMVNVKRLTEKGATGPLEPLPINNNFFESGSTMVEFRGGTLSVDATKLTGLTYTIPGHFTNNGVGDTLQIPMLIKWAPSAGSNVTITIEDLGKNPVPTKTFTLAAGETACVYQWDGPPSASRPAPATFMDLTSVGCDPNPDPNLSAEAVVDVDFKWIYEMVAPATGTWAEWRNGKKLPAPISVCAKGKDKDFVSRVSDGIEPKTAPGRDCLAGLWAE